MPCPTPGAGQSTCSFFSVCSFAGVDAGVCRPSCALSGCTVGACQSGYCTEQQLRAVQAAADPITDGGTQVVALPVEYAVVTALKPLVAGADPTDAPGFFVQAGTTGLFVQATPTPLPAVGDRVSFGVTSVSKELGQRRAKGISNYQRLASGQALPMPVDVSTLDLTRAAVQSANESALTRVVMRVVAANTFDAGTQGYGEVSFSSLPATTTLRLSAALNLGEDLRGGCSVSATGPLWLGPGPGGKVSTWTSAALAGSSCPDPQLVAASSPTFTTLEVTTSRYMALAVPSSFVLRWRGSPQSVSVTTVSLLNPQRYLLQAPMQAGWEYELLPSTSPPVDTRGRPVAPGAPLGVVAGGCQSLEPLVISGVWYSTLLATSSIELHNRSSVPINLGTSNYRLVVRASGGGNARSLTGTIPPGGYYHVTEGTFGGDDNWGGMNLSSSSFVALGVNLNNACNPPNAADIVVFGNSPCGTGPLPPLNNGEALRRMDGPGCVKTANVAADFTRLTNPPAPRSLASQAATCLCP
jgi:hypothetical protein